MGQLQDSLLSLYLLRRHSCLAQQACDSVCASRRFDAGKPCAPLESSSNNLKLQISDAVLCSEMGVHFSPCGRFVAATTACRAPLPQAGGHGVLQRSTQGCWMLAAACGASAGSVAAGISMLWRLCLYMRPTGE